jgi:hypothetical protein
MVVNIIVSWILAQEIFIRRVMHLTVSQIARNTTFIY